MAEKIEKGIGARIGLILIILRIEDKKWEYTLSDLQFYLSQGKAETSPLSIASFLAVSKCFSAFRNILS
jgi:hypothetical protein